MIHHFLSPAFPCALLALTLGPAASGQAQTPAPKPPPPRVLRVLALGDPPPFMQEVKGNVRRELEAEPGTIPPRELAFGTGEKASTVAIQLNRVSAALQLAAGAEAAVFRAADAAKDSNAKPWLSLRVAQEGDLLAMVWRDPGKNWFEPRGILLPDSATAFPAGHLRIVNLLPTETSLLLDKERILLEAGKSVVRALPTGRDQAIQIAYRNADGTYEPFHHGSVVANPGERVQAVVYRADKANPRRPAKFIVYNEIAPSAAP